MQKTLVAFDADRIKSYVFGTDKLKEIRGASARLERLNRETMRREAQNIGKGQIHPIYTNGGQGLFVVIADDAETIATTFGKHVQIKFTEMTRGGASVTYVIQPLPANLPDDIDTLKQVDLSSYLQLIQVKMDLKKGCPSAIVALPSHPLMRQCDACGIRYAEEHIIDNHEANDLFYCSSCREKLEEDKYIDRDIEKNVQNILKGNKISSEQNILNKGLWERISFYLEEAQYKFDPSDTQQTPQRPNDFHAFRPFAESKEYIGLIYADANNMGAKVSQLGRLITYEKFAEGVDRAIHQAMSRAIKKHLPVVQITAEEKISNKTSPEQAHEQMEALFPFDIFLVGGDDIVMLTDAAKAMDVALTIAQEFHQLMQEFSKNTPELYHAKDQNYSLSIGVVMAPIKYPFRLMLGLAEKALKDAKKASSTARTDQKNNPAKDFDDTRINFRIVNGGIQINQENPYVKKYDGATATKEQEFYATLRPYAPQDLDLLLQTIRKGRELKLGRTKLHQLREAILKMNNTTSVGESMAVLHNWNATQRDHVMAYHRNIGSRYQRHIDDPNNPLAGLPRITFPWFLDGNGQSVYRTALLDLVELYDFVSREQGGPDE